MKSDLPVFLSLGAGVQSSALALMATAGGVGPMPEAAIFADTGDEPQSVYRWLDWLEKQLAFPVHRVSHKGRKLSDDATRLVLSKKSGNTYVPIGIPAYTTETVMERHVIDWEMDEDEKDEHAIYGPPELTVKKGMGRRQCTRTFKIEPINQKIRELLNGKKGIVWIGISTDEAHRMKPSQNPAVEHKWPLIEMGISRAECLKWMEDAGWPKPPRSACVYCPYHSDKEWLRLKTEEPTEFYAAVEFEKRLQTAYAAATALRSTPWLHASRIPLSEVVFKPKVEEPSLFGNECEGICGV